jgi:hypothetical protein
MATASEADGATRTVAAIRARFVLNSIKLPPGARWVIGNGELGMAVNDTVPQVKIQFAAVAPNDNSLQRRLLYAGALALVFLATALSTFLLYRDIRRETGLALLRSAFVSSVSHDFALLSQPSGPTPRCSTWAIQAPSAPYLKTIIGERTPSRLVEGVLDSRV